MVAGIYNAGTHEVERWKQEAILSYIAEFETNLRYIWNLSQKERKERRKGGRDKRRSLSLLTEMYRRFVQCSVMKSKNNSSACLSLAE